MINGSEIDRYKDDCNCPIGEESYFPFENFSTFFPIPLIGYEHENIVSVSQFHDKSKTNHVY